jgi:steroid delta-isomerase-like uncharacterized protein
MTQGYRASVTVAAVRSKEECMGDLKALADAATEAFNAHDEERIRSFYADDAVFTAPGGVELQGADAIAGYAMAWLNAFPDATTTIHQQVIGDDWVAERFTFAGTHTETLASPDGDIPATGKSLSGRGAELVRFRDGKIVEDHLYYDQLDVVTQLGLMQEGAAATA